MAEVDVCTKKAWDDLVHALGSLLPHAHLRPTFPQPPLVDQDVSDIAGSSAAVHQTSDCSNDAAHDTAHLHPVDTGSATSAYPGPIKILRIMPSTVSWTGPTTSQLSNLLGHPDLSGLQDLCLDRCSDIVNLPPCISDLSNLRRLEIHLCSNVANLPAGLGCLTSLQQLTIAHCGSVTVLPDDIVSAQQVALEDVSFRACHNLTALPLCLGTLPALESLDLYECRSLGDLPTSLSNSPSLRSIRFLGCEQLATAVGPVIGVHAEDVPATRKKVSNMLHRLARHRAVIELATGQEHMLQTLERLSWIAVLLATATFVGFLQPVHQDHFDPYASPEHAFAILDILSFLLSLTCLVTIVVLSMPRISSENERREAGRFWLLLVTAWVQLYLAVVTGCGAFIASAFAYYPPSAPEIWVPVSLTCMMLFLGACSVIQRFKSLFPGIGCVWYGLTEIWQRDLPFSKLFPCLCLGSCIRCDPCVGVYKAHGMSDLEANCCVDCCVDVVMSWRSYLRRKGIIEDGV